VWYDETDLLRKPRRFVSITLLKKEAKSRVSFGRTAMKLVTQAMRILRTKTIFA
jgi:hypothetical protein